MLLDSTALDLDISTSSRSLSPVVFGLASRYASFPCALNWPVYNAGGSETGPHLRLVGLTPFHHLLSFRFSFIESILVFVLQLFTACSTSIFLTSSKLFSKNDVETCFHRFDIFARRPLEPGWYVSLVLSFSHPSLRSDSPQAPVKRDNNKDYTPSHDSNKYDYNSYSKEYKWDDKYYDKSKYDDKKYDDKKYDDKKYGDKKYDDKKYDDKYDGKYDDKYDDKYKSDYKYDDKKYDDKKYGDKKYDDKKYDDKKYDDKYDGKYDDKYDDKYKSDYKYDDKYKSDNKYKWEHQPKFLCQLPPKDAPWYGEYYKWSRTSFPRLASVPWLNLPFQMARTLPITRMTTITRKGGITSMTTTTRKGTGTTTRKGARTTTSTGATTRTTTSTRMTTSTRATARMTTSTRATTRATASPTTSPRTPTSSRYQKVRTTALFGNLIWFTNTLLQ